MKFTVVYRRTFVSLAVLLGFGIATYLLGAGIAGIFDYGKRKTNIKIPKCPNCNVILILVDTLRADHVGCYGYQRDTTPNIDAFAEHGIVFKNTFSVAPSTKPSITSLFTSLYPSQHNAIYNQDVLNDELITIAEILGKNAYNTYAVSNKPVYNKQLNCHQGFDEWIDAPKRAREFVTSVTSSKLSSYKEPFFLWLHYNDPHSPYIADEPFTKFFNPDYKGPVDGSRPYKKNYFRKRPNELKQLLDLYDNDIRWNDFKIGKLFKSLKDNQLYDKSIIILLSDHGEMFLEHGYFEHSNGLYSELINVPLIMKVPGGPQNVASDTYVQNTDILPTILDIVGVDGNYPFVGKAIRKIINKPNRSMYVEHLRLRRKKPQRGLIVDKYKILEDLKNGTHHVYDLESDPGEKRPLDDGLILEKMKQKLDERTKSIGSSNRVERKTRNLDDETKKLLKALGYME